MLSNNPFLKNVITKFYLALLTLTYLPFQFIIEKSEIIEMQALKVFKKKFQILIGLKHLGTRTQNENCKVLTGTSMNIFRNYFPHKK